MNFTNEALEQLALTKIKSVIAPENQHFLAALAIFETIDSTNTYLLSLAKVGAPSGSICLAEEQTQGRGRRGREWISPKGTNIYCSLLWRFSESQQNLSSLSLAIAVMLIRALKKMGIENGIQLKWPNDVWYAGRKLAGILLESTDASNIVIGIGLNVAPVTQAQDAISIAEITHTLPLRNKIAGLLINELLGQLPVFQAHGIKPFLDDWRQYDMLCGKAVDIFLPDKTLTGTMLGVDKMGRLLLQDADDNLLSFSYGEVSVRYSNG